MQARTSILIARPADEAFAFIADTSNDRRWRSHLTTSHGRATAVGDRVTQTYLVRGKTKTIELEVSGFQPPERLTYVMREPVRARISFQCRAEGNGTRVSMSMSATVSGPAALFEGRIQSEGDKFVRAELDRLKRALESVE